MRLRDLAAFFTHVKQEREGKAAGEMTQPRTLLPAPPKFPGGTTSTFEIGDDVLWSIIRSQESTSRH